MSSHTVQIKEKPRVPPKPKHLVTKNDLLPKPPDSAVRSIQDVLQTMKIQDHYAEDGYLKPITNPTQTRAVQKEGLQVNEQTSKVRKAKTQIRNSAVKREDPELVESSTVRDVRQRPLPLLPGEKVQSIVGMPWFSPFDRRKAEDLVRNGTDGCFLVRPSSKGQSSLALTLWFRGRPYNIPIRKRPDGNYALGTPKDLEQSFISIEEMILNYEREELVLFSNGVETGRTTLHPLYTSS